MPFMRHIAPVRVASLLGAAALLFAACTASGATSPSASVPASTAPSAAPSAAASAAASAGSYAVAVVQDAKLGAYLTGEDGKTLYMFKKDSAGKSACNGQCATTWPPFTLDTGETVTAGSGVTGTLATIKRDDGTAQVTYNGAPLYYYSADKKAGDTNGQGLFNLWFVASPTGTSGAVAASPSAGSGGSYYGRGASSAPSSPAASGY